MATCSYRVLLSDGIKSEKDLLTTVPKICGAFAAYRGLGVQSIADRGVHTRVQSALRWEGGEGSGGSVGQRVRCMSLYIRSRY